MAPRIYCVGTHRPTGMDNATLKEEMVFIVQDVNKNIPSQYDDKDIDMVLEKIDGHVRALHGARTWPTIKTFIQQLKMQSKITTKPSKYPAISSANLQS
jgi:hypothetical protein